MRVSWPLVVLAFFFVPGCKKKPKTVTYQIEHVAVGRAHACALTSSGAVWCWGKNDRGQVGGGTFDDHARPFELVGLKDVDAIYAGAAMTCARKKATHAIECWGTLVRGPSSDGAGHGSNDEESVPSDASTLRDVADLAIGTSHACALLGPGTVKCWGRTDFGELGIGPVEDVVRKTPADVGGLWGVKGIAVGGHHACAIANDTSVRCWGKNQDGQLGDGTTVDRDVPVQVKGLTGVISISAGASFTCAVRSDHGVMCWGKNDVGQLGDGTTSARPRTTPLDVKGIETAFDVAIGDAHACAHLQDGTLRCWGRNEAGQMTDGTRDPKPAPGMVSGLFNVQEVKAGGSTTCARLADASVHCWGGGRAGQVGDGAREDRPVPVVVRWPSGGPAPAAAGGW